MYLAYLMFLFNRINIKSGIYWKERRKEIYTYKHDYNTTRLANDEFEDDPRGDQTGIDDQYSPNSIIIYNIMLWLHNIWIFKLNGPSNVSFTHTHTHT